MANDLIYNLEMVNNDYVAKQQWLMTLQIFRHCRWWPGVWKGSGSWLWQRPPSNGEEDMGPTSHDLGARPMTKLKKADPDVDMISGDVDMAGDTVPDHEPTEWCQWRLTSQRGDA